MEQNSAGDVDGCAAGCQGVPALVKRVTAPAAQSAAATADRAAASADQAAAPVGVRRLALLALSTLAASLLVACALSLVLQQTLPPWVSALALGAGRLAVWALALAFCSVLVWIAFWSGQDWMPAAAHGPSAYFFSNLLIPQDSPAMRRAREVSPKLSGSRAQGQMQQESSDSGSDLEGWQQ